MQNPFKEFLYFSRGERRGILVLITGIILVFLSGYIYIYQRENRPLSDEVIRRQATAMAEYESFIASIQEKEQKWDNRLKPSSQKQPTTVSLARFNPNTADSVTFCRLGLPYRETNVLLLDEPTNHLDVDAKEELARALKAYKGSILLICHEPEFYEGFATRVVDCSEFCLRG